MHLGGTLLEATCPLRQPATAGPELPPTPPRGENPRGQSVQAVFLARACLITVVGWASAEHHRLTGGGGRTCKRRYQTIPLSGRRLQGHLGPVLDIRSHPMDGLFPLALASGDLTVALGSQHIRK